MKLICFICLMPLLSYGQVVDYSKFHGVDIKNNLALPLRGISFLNYKNVKVFGKFPSRDSVVISSPEDLVSVILSANNKKWLLSYFENPKDALIFEQYNSKMLPNDTSKYFVMLSKMTIKRDNKERTIIKFLPNTNSKINKPVTLVLTKNLNSWKITNDKFGIENLFFIIEYLKPKILRELFTNGDFEDSDLDLLRQNTRVELEGQEQNMDLKKLIAIIKKWQLENNSLLLKKVSDAI